MNKISKAKILNIAKLIQYSNHSDISNNAVFDWGKQLYDYIKQETPITKDKSYEIIVVTDSNNNESMLICESKDVKNVLLEIENNIDNFNDILSESSYNVSLVNIHFINRRNEQ